LIYSDWPTYQEAYLVVDEIEMVVQVNGKLRGRFVVGIDLPEDEVKKLALENSNVTKHIEGLTIRKVIVVPNKLVNIVAN
jgi:leucyl-tRNA synthetase